MASKIKQSQFEQTLKKFNDVDFEKVFRDNLGDSSLSEIKPYIEDIKSQLVTASSTINEIPDTIVTKINSGVTELITKLSSIQRSNDSTFVSQLNSNKNFFTTNADKSQEWISELTTIKTINDLKNLDLININESLKKELKQVKAEKKKIEKVTSGLETKINEFENRYNNTTTKQELQLQSDHYKTEAERHKRKSYLWILLIVIYLPILLIFIHNAIIFGNLMSLDFDAATISTFGSNCESCSSTFLNYQFIRGIGLRILLFSILLYILSFLRKNYNAEKHNQILNQQRANSLNSSLMLLEKAKTPEGKDEILKMACNAIFSQHNTGYIKKENEGNIKLLDSIKTTIATK